MKKILIGSVVALSTYSALVYADQVFNDDVIVVGSECVGVDCVNGEAFGFDTIRLKENNLRIKFQDTSNSGSFPTVDWQLTANDSSNGGANKFSIDDVDNARTPFTVEAGARNNALFVEADGDVGFGTNNPVVDLHNVTGNTPTLRLDQDGSSGFTPQTWDVAGNETNFFVRDVTNGSSLPFRIRPGSGNDNALYIDSDGDIGMGTASPSAATHIRRTNGTASLKVEEASNTPAVRELLSMSNNGGSYVSMVNTATNDTWYITHENNSPNDLIISHSIGGTQFRLSSNGDVQIQGSLTTGGTTCSGGCDLVFTESYPLETIEEHAEMMWSNKHLPGVGQTQENAPINLTQKTGGVLNELEKAHIYIEQLHERLKGKESEMQSLKGSLASLEERLSALENN